MVHTIGWLRDQVIGYQIMQIYADLCRSYAYLGGTVSLLHGVCGVSELCLISPLFSYHCANSALLWIQL